MKKGIVNIPGKCARNTLKNPIKHHERTVKNFFIRLMHYGVRGLESKGSTPTIELPEWLKVVTAPVTL